MTLDEILAAYEDLWREAALTDRPQMRVGAGGVVNGQWPRATCAALIAPHSLETQSTLYEHKWVCRECGSSHFWVGSVMRHLNDAHEWDWITFANKFRDALEAGRP